MEGKNFGDALNSTLYKFISGTDSVHHKMGYTGEAYMMIGSILNQAKAKTIVWGSGIAQTHGDIGLKCDIRAVRGPLSKYFADLNGIECPEVYGDPVLLMPRYYNPDVTKKYKLGIIPHVLDYGYVSITGDDITVIDLLQSYDEVIKQIKSCDKVISSSLHGLIAADAYGIPSKWVEFGDRVIGGGLKFQDYYQSIGYMDETPLDFRNNDVSIKNTLTAIVKHDIQLDIDMLYDACPFKK